MESWRLVWRDGFQPQFSSDQLRKLWDGLRTDDQRLTRGSTTIPPPLMCVSDWPVEAADAIAYAVCDWGNTTVGEAEEFFARACFQCDQTLGEPAACRWWLNAWDDLPRGEIFRELAAEIESELQRRGEVVNQIQPEGSAK